MNPASKDISAILAADSGLGLTLATDLFVGKEPALPDNCVTIFDIPGDAPLLTLSGKGGIEYYYNSIQVRVRNNSYVTGWELIHDIHAFLHGINNQIEGGTQYMLIKAVDEPALLSWDDNDRAQFIATFAIQRQ